MIKYLKNTKISFALILFIFLFGIPSVVFSAESCQCSGMIENKTPPTTPPPNNESKLFNSACAEFKGKLESPFKCIFPPFITDADEKTCENKGSDILSALIAKFGVAPKDANFVISCAWGDPPKDAVKINFPASSPTPSAPTKPKVPDIVKLDNPLVGDTTKPTEIIGRIIKMALSVMGGLVLLMVVWGGFQWLTAAGSPEKVKSGMQTILWAVLGAVITLSSYVILNTILSYLK